VDQVHWLSDEEQRAWRALAGVVMLLPSALDTQLQRDAQLTHFAYTVLAMLSESPTRSARMSELAALANGSQSRLSHLVARLEERGWVRRERTPEDGRGYVAVLTDAGYEKVVESAPGHVGEVRRLVFDALTPEQVARMAAVARAILATVDEDETC
jgi:DNA-binding MarR family transcriptional regulator